MSNELAGLDAGRHACPVHAQSIAYSFTCRRPGQSPDQTSSLECFSNGTGPEGPHALPGAPPLTRAVAVSSHCFRHNGTCPTCNALSGPSHTGNSGGLSYSTDFPGAGGGAPDLRGSLSTSQAMLSPISEGGTSKPKLEPLK